MKTPTTKLQALRQEAGLSQEDLAFLLGGETAGMISRHERGERTPNLETGLGYALVLGTGVDELFEDLQENIKAGIRERAQILATSLPPDPRDTRMTTRIITLEKLRKL